MTKIKSKAAMLHLTCGLLVLIFAQACTMSAIPPGDTNVKKTNLNDTNTVSEVPECKLKLGEQLQALNSPGAAVAAIADGQIKCLSVAGLANTQNSIPIKRSTVFGWASVSKMITAVAALTLVDSDQVDLDADISQYLGFSVRNPNCNSTAITLRHLLTHTSSISDNETIYDSVYTTGDSPISLQRFVTGYFQSGGEYYDEDENFSQRCPGEQHQYSNIGAGLIGYIVESVTGQKLDVYSAEKIYRPLQMNEASFHLRNLNLQNIATDYIDGQAQPHVGFPTYPDGLFRTSIAQMANFFAMLSQGGQHSGKRILSEQIVKEMQRRQFPNVEANQGLIGFYEGGHRFGHDGEEPGASVAFFNPETGVGGLLVTNGNFWESNGGETLALSIIDQLYAEAKP